MDNQARNEDEIYFLGCTDWHTHVVKVLNLFWAHHKILCSIDA